MLRQRHEVLASKAMNPASNLILIGPTGAGKTSIGRRLAERFSLDFVDADQAIVEHAGTSIADIFERGGESAFRAIEKRVLGQLLQRDRLLLSSGGGAVLDADNRELMARRGFVVYLKVSVAEQLSRLARDRTRPLLQRPDREQVLEQMARVRDPLYRQIADLSVTTDHLTPAEATAQVVVRLAAQWQLLENPA